MIDEVTEESSADFERQWKTVETNEQTEVKQLLVKPSRNNKGAGKNTGE